MRSTYSGLQNRAVRRVSVALFAVATLAACDSDRALSPSPAAKLPTSGSSAIVPGGRGDLLIGSLNGDMTTINVIGSSWDVITPLGDTMKVVDNVKFDSDLTLGRAKVSKVLAGKYTVCPATAPNGYAFPQTLCITTTVVSGSGAGIGFIAYQAPSIFWDVRSTALSPILGGTYSVASSRINKAGFNVSDNGPNDLDPTVGRVAVKVGIGSYSVCEVTPPAGFWPAVTTCLSPANPNGGTKWAGQFVNQEKQVVYNP